MKVKKFTCHKCGAPKVNAYSGAYVVCDYCNTIIDIDFASSDQIVKSDPEATAKWTEFYIKYMTLNPQYISEGNKKKHRDLQYEYCKTYFSAAPHLLPPNIPSGEVFEQYCRASADFMSESAFNKEFQQLKSNYEKLYASIEYFQDTDGQTKANYDSFAAMLDAYMIMLEMEVQLMYGNSKYELFNEYYPEEFNRKQRISQIAQMWLPYLKEPHSTGFLEKYELKPEYVDIQPPQLTQINCEKCRKELKVPKGAISCVCKHCRHQNNIKATVNCHSCGVENPLPSKWRMIINCNSCGTELRVVQPLFG